MRLLVRVLFYWLPAIVIILVGVLAYQALAQDAAAMRAQFFKDAKRAILVSSKGGQRFNCCEPGEANRVAITGANATHLRAKITGHFRDKSRKIGSEIEIGKGRVAVWPVPPPDMGEVAFVSQYGGAFVYCFFGQLGG